MSDNSNPTEPPSKKQKRSTLKKDDYDTVEIKLNKGEYKVVHYSQNDANTNYKYVYCIVDSKNQTLKFAKQINDKTKDNSYNSALHIPLSLTIGETPYIFCCKKCYESNFIHLWKSNGMFRDHQVKIHGLVLKTVTSEQHTQKVQQLKNELLLKEMEIQKLKGEIKKLRNYISLNKHKPNCKEFDELVEDVENDIITIKDNLNDNVR
eukprot:367068_1